MHRCNSAIPTAESKEDSWNLILNKDNQLSLKNIEARLEGFYQWNQLDLIQPYFDRVLEKLPEVADNYWREFLLAFFHNLHPHMEVKQEYVDTLKAMEVGARED